MDTIHYLRWLHKEQPTAVLDQAYQPSRLAFSHPYPAVLYLTHAYIYTVFILTFRLIRKVVATLLKLSLNLHSEIVDRLRRVLCPGR